MRLIFVMLTLGFALPAVAQTNWTEHKMGGTMIYNGTDSEGGHIPPVPSVGQYNLCDVPGQPWQHHQLDASRRLRSKVYSYCQ